MRASQISISLLPSSFIYLFLSLALTVRPQPVKELLLAYWLVQNNKTELLWLGVIGQDVRWAPMSDQVHGVVKKIGRVRNLGFSCMNSLRCRALLNLQSQSAHFVLTGSIAYNAPASLFKLIYLKRLCYFVAIALVDNRAEHSSSSEL